MQQPSGLAQTADAASVPAPWGSASGRRFRSAPPSISAFIAAVLEPTLHVGMLHLAHGLAGVPFTHASVALLLLVMVLTFPGANRFRDPPLRAGLDILVSWALVVAQMLACGWLTDSLGLYDERMLLGWVVASPLALWSAVLLGGLVLRRRNRENAMVRRAVIVGAGPFATMVAGAVGRRRDVPTEVKGFFDDRRNERADGPARERWLGPLSALTDHVRRHAIDQVYITLPLGSQRIRGLLESLQGTTASLYLVPDLSGASIIQGRLQDVNGLAVVGLCETPFTGVNEVAKRSFDIAVSLVVLALAAPLMALVAVGIKLDSPGPVLFLQRRNGLGGEEIVVYKFRTMRAADDGSVVRQARRGDPRITTFGSWLRRTSIDELPQFINVLQGRMSIVGPRPHAVAHNEQYATLIASYMVRHKVRPGITGWAQVNGHRGETDTVDKMRARVECDIEYLRNWSLGLDLHIMARTVRLVLGDRHAY